MQQSEYNSRSAFAYVPYVIFTAFVVSIAVCNYTITNHNHIKMKKHLLGEISEFIFSYKMWYKNTKFLLIDKTEHRIIYNCYLHNFISFV